MFDFNILWLSFCRCGKLANSKHAKYLTYMETLMFWGLTLMWNPRFLYQGMWCRGSVNPQSMVNDPNKNEFSPLILRFLQACMWTRKLGSCSTGYIMVITNNWIFPFSPIWRIHIANSGVKTDPGLTLKWSGPSDVTFWSLPWLTSKVTLENETLKVISFLDCNNIR